MIRLLVEGIHQLHNLSADQCVISINVQNNAALLTHCEHVQHFVAQCSNVLLVLDERGPRSESGVLLDSFSEHLVCPIGGGIVCDEELIVRIVLVFYGIQKFLEHGSTQQVSPCCCEADGLFFWMLSYSISLVHLIVLRLKGKFLIPVFKEI